MRRTTNIREKEERKHIIEHQPRYLETNRTVEQEFHLAPYDRVTNYDLVNRKVHEYQDIDDSYVVRQKGARVSNAVVREYRPGEYEMATRQSRKSVVNPAYQAEGYVESTGVQARYANDAVSTEYRPRAQAAARAGSGSRYVVEEANTATRSYGIENQRIASGGTRYVEEITPSVQYRQEYRDEGAGVFRTEGSGRNMRVEEVHSSKPASSVAYKEETRSLGSNQRFKLDVDDDSEY